MLWASKDFLAKQHICRRRESPDLTFFSVLPALCQTFRGANSFQVESGYLESQSD